MLVLAKALALLSTLINVLYGGLKKALLLAAIVAFAVAVITTGVTITFIHLIQQ